MGGMGADERAMRDVASASREADGLTSSEEVNSRWKGMKLGCPDGNKWMVSVDHFFTHTTRYN